MILGRRTIIPLFAAAESAKNAANVLPHMKGWICIPITVIKRDGTREIFDKAKLQNGIIKSCNKRPVTAQQIQKLVDDIENTLAGSGEREVESKQLGNMVIERLKDLDEVAYVRFASVYRQFKDINSFIDELEKMLHEKNGNS